MKPIDELEFTDDYMFGEVLKDKELCKGILERLLQIQIKDIEYPELQKAIKVGYEVHGIRLDVYVRDSNKVYDIEMQNNAYDSLGKRTRFYQSILDADTLLRGKHYSELKESYIIFICKNDPFDKNLKVYTFETTCLEDSKISINDKSHKLIYNANSYKTETDSNLKALMRYVTTNIATDDFTDSINKRVARIKESETFRTEYLKMYIGMEDEKRRAVKENTEKTEKAVKEKTAIECLKDRVPFEKISKWIGLPIERVEELSKQLESTPAN